MRYTILTWIGIIGATLTLFSSAAGALNLADWASIIVKNWDRWTHTVWSWTLSWLGIEIPRHWSYLLTFLLFYASTTVGTWLAYRRDARGLKAGTQEPPTWDFRHVWVEDELSQFFLVSILCGYPIGAALLLGLHHHGESVALKPYAPILFLALSTLLAWLFLIFFGREIRRSFCNILVVAILSFVIAFAPSRVLLAQEYIVRAGAAYMLAFSGYFPMLALIPLAVMPARILNRRLLIILVGVVLLLILNEVSKLDKEIFSPT
jgi:hypothetical protein